MNHRIIIECREYSTGKALWMLGLVESFRKAFDDRRPQDSVVYAQGPAKAEVYWTSGRTIVVRELE